MRSESRRSQLDHERYMRNREERLQKQRDYYRNNTELSKTGFDIVLDTELQNNMGTAQELTEKVLEGTDWRLDKEGSSNLLQTTEEPVYESEYVRATAFTAVNQTNNEKSEVITTTDKSKFLTFYSQIQDILDLALSGKKFTGGQKATLQFLFSKDGEFTTEINRQLQNLHF